MVFRAQLSSEQSGRENHNDYPDIQSFVGDNSCTGSYAAYIIEQPVCCAAVVGIEELAFATSIWLSNFSHIFYDFMLSQSTEFHFFFFGFPMLLCCKTRRTH